MNPTVVNRVSLLVLCCAWTASAHAISMSSGLAKVEGNRVEYVLRMPDYEIGNLHNPEQALFNHVVLTSAGETGRRISQECHHDPGSANVICVARYLFSEPVEKLGVECSLYEVTVANHIHVLRAELNGKSDRAILDSGFSSATLAFRPPTAFEMGVEQFTAGVVRIATNRTQLLLLLALAVAARKWLELGVLSIAFFAAQALAVTLIPSLVWQPPARFAEAATASGLAYLAFEMFFFPISRARGFVSAMAAVLFGAFSGLYLSIFLTDARYPPAIVLGGAVALSIFVLCLLRAGLRTVANASFNRVAAGALLIIGCTWFAIRLRA